MTTAATRRSFCRICHAACPEDVEIVDGRPAHSWGSSTGTDEKVRDIGGPTNRLIDVENGYCPITGQAIQSAIPVSVEPENGGSHERR